MAVAKSTLRILTLERLGETFNQQSCPLRYTPRKFIIHPEHKVWPLAMSIDCCAVCSCLQSLLNLSSLGQQRALSINHCTATTYRRCMLCRASTYAGYLAA